MIKCQEFGSASRDATNDRRAGQPDHSGLVRVRSCREILECEPPVNIIFKELVCFFLASVRVVGMRICRKVPVI
jgi:hypothetical protein